MIERTIPWEALLAERAWLRRLARHLAGDGASADELASDVLADACVQKPPRVAAPRTWLRALAVRSAAARHRSRERRQRRERAVAKSEELGSTLETSIAFELQREVASAVSALPEPYRTTILLRYWEGLPPRRIARVMNAPVETVQTRTKRAHALLREKLDAAYGGDRKAWASPLLVLLDRDGLVTWSWILSGGLAMSFGSKSFVAAALALCAVGLWLADERSEAPTPAVVLPSERLPEGDLAHLGTARRSAAEVGARPLPPEIAAAAPSARRSATGRLVADEDERVLEPARISYRARTGEFRDLSFHVAPTEAKPFELALGEAADSPIDELWIRVEGRALLRHRLRAEAASAASAPQCVDLGVLRVPRGSSFRGRVIDAQERPVEGAVLLLPSIRTGWGAAFHPENMLMRTTRVGTSGPGGRFELEERIAPDIAHALLFAATSAGLGWAAIAPSRGGEPEPQELCVSLRPTGALHVKVVDGAGAPRTVVRVRARPKFSPIGVERGETAFDVADDVLADSLFVAIADAEGNARFPALPIGVERESSPGTCDLYELRVEGEGLPDQPWLRVRIEAGRMLDQEIALATPRTVTLEIDVRDDLEAPIEGARVVAYGLALADASSDAHGRASMRLEATTQLRVSATSAHHVDASASLDPAESAEPIRVTLRLARALPFEGRVTDQRGRPAAGFQLFLGQRHLTETDATGSFRVAKFPVGPQRVVVAMPSSGSSTWKGGQRPEVVDAADGPATFVLERREGSSTPLRIEVVEQGSGNALEPADHLLYATNAAGELVGSPTRVRVEGHALVTEDAGSGLWRVDVRAASGQRGGRTFAIPEGAERFDLRLELPPTGTIDLQLVAVDVELPEELVIHAGILPPDPRSAGSFAHAGRWEVQAPHRLAESKTLEQGRSAAPWMQQSLRVLTSGTRRLRLQSADTTCPIRFEARGVGLEGSVDVRARAGANVAVELRLVSKPK